MGLLAMDHVDGCADAAEAPASAVASDMVSTASKARKM